MGEAAGKLGPTSRERRAPVDEAVKFALKIWAQVVAGPGSSGLSKVAGGLAPQQHLKRETRAAVVPCLAISISSERHPTRAPSGRTVDQAS